VQLEIVCFRLILVFSCREIRYRIKAQYFY